MSNLLTHLTREFRPFFDDPTVEEVCIQEPGAAWVWSKGGFARHAIGLSATDIENIAIVAAAQRRQNVGPHEPLLATDLAGAGRLQIVLPPCVAEGKPSLTIRRGNTFSPTVDQLATGGLFKQTRAAQRQVNPADARLIELYRASDWQAFFCEAVAAKKTIVLSGENGSGKTTFAKALIHSIPLHERLLSIEDTPEFTDLPHPNRVAMYYDKNKAADLGPRHLVEAALRMRIGRLLLQEIRDGDAATAFLTALQSGHPGGITTIHAPSAEGVFDRLRTMIKQSSTGANASDVDVNAQLRALIHITVQCTRTATDFAISEVWFGLAGDHAKVADVPADAV